MAITNLQKNQHLLWRAGFGPTAPDLGRLEQINPNTLFKELISASAAAPSKIDVADPDIKAIYSRASMEMGMARRRMKGKSAVGESEKRRLARLSRQNVKALNLAWLNLMVSSKQQLREKIALFWHGHFSTISGNILHQQQLLDVIRQHATGNFGELLKAVSRSASMINFLNNNQNRKNRPNENFAREVMELFTIGRGNYTEQDVKEAARAFTGWGANIAGDFVMRKQQHDDGPKTFMGKSGNFNGNDILDIILERRETALYLTDKIYRFYVNEVPDKAFVQKTAEKFYQSGYNITTLLTAIFTSDKFYEESNIGTHIKSPVELIVGLRRVLNPSIDNEEVQLLLQRLLGQVLFYPPNVAGWPGGYTWIDSSSLMLRMQIPKLFAANESLRMKPKDNDDQMMGMKDPEMQDLKVKNKKAAGAKPIRATIDWQPLIATLASTHRSELSSKLSRMLLVPALGKQLAIAEKFADASDRGQFIKTAAIQILCTPEYQLC